MNFLNKVFHANCLDLLRHIPDGEIDAVISDPMFGTAKSYRYEWGLEPAKGNPVAHWRYHRPIYEECLRVLRPRGILAWAQGAKFCEQFPKWFGPHRLWTLTRFTMRQTEVSGHCWVVQTREGKAVRFPNEDALVFHSGNRLRKFHPCVKPVEELEFMVENLTAPGEIVFDPCCGLGSTLIAAKKLGRQYVGCDLSAAYSRIAVQRLLFA